MSFQFKSKNLSLRDITNKDNELLYKLYCLNRVDEMKLMTGWTDMQKENFLKMQFDAQHTYYQHQYKGGGFYIIEHNRKPVGRFYMHENYENNGIRLIEITLFHNWRSKGICTKIVNQVVEYAKEKNRAVTLQVEITNGAIKLHEKLGFVKVSSTNTHHLMEWRPMH